MTNYVITVVTCQKYIKSRVPIQHNSCLKDADYRVFVGKEAVEGAISLDCGDSYLDLKDKTIKLLEWFLTTNYDYLVKVDDDTFIDVKALTALHHPTYCGGFIYFSKVKRSREYHTKYESQQFNTTPDYSYFDLIEDNFRYAEGGFYILNRDSVIKILAYIKSTYLPNIIHEDIFVGLIAHRLHLTIQDVSLENDWYTITPYSIHPCSPIHFNQLSRLHTIEERINIAKRLLYTNQWYNTYYN